MKSKASLKKMPPIVSQEMLQGMLGTMRPRFDYFMSIFRKLGFMNRNCRLWGLQVEKFLLSVFQQEKNFHELNIWI